MLLSEIYSSISSHLIKGTMFHSQLATYYIFLGLEGYAKFHQHQYLEESTNYARLCQYYVKHHNRIIVDSHIADPEVIPESWFDKRRIDISTDEIPKLVANAANRWVQWEKSTKDLLQRSYKELINIGEVASAKFIFGYIEDVDDELAYAESEQLLLDSTGYDMSYIADLQKEMSERYFKKKVKVG